MSLSAVRMLLLFDAIAFGAWILCPFVGWETSETIESIRQWQGYGAIVPPSLFAGVSWVLLAARCLMTGGMWFDRHWGGAILFFVIAVPLILAPFQGIGIQTPLEMAFGYLSTILDGALLMVAWFRLWKRRAGWSISVVSRSE